MAEIEQIYMITEKSDTKFMGMISRKWEDKVRWRNC